MLNKPYFTFPDIPSSEELSFEKLTLKNFQQLYIMFEQDENAFTDNRFKHYEKAKKYAEYLEQYGAYAPKHGGQDWLFLRKGEYAGVLHLYDLSLEQFLENNIRCWIGFATKPAMRQKGITTKALRYFIDYIFKNYPLINYIHCMTRKENFAAQNLLKAVRLPEDEEETLSEEYVFYVRKRQG